jgi:methylthioxylose transferase
VTATTGTPPARARVARSAGSRRTAVTLGLLVGLVLLTHWWGDALARTTRIGLATPPLHAVWGPRFGVPSVLVVALGIVIVIAGPGVAERVDARMLPWAAGAGAGVWSVALAATDGGHGLTGGVVGPHGYLAAVPRVGSPGGFLRGFADAARAGALPVHVTGHPPGFVLVLWCLDRVGLGGRGPAAALCILGGAGAVGLVTVAVRAVAGTTCARAAAPFLVLSPAAIWIATTPDAFFAFVAAAAVALFCLAAMTSGARATALALGAGACLGSALLLSYGLVLVAVVGVLVAARHNAWRQLRVAAVATTGVLLSLAPFGFSWVDGLLATRHAYWRGIASTRPYRYFVLADVAAFALCIGPATVVALTRLRDRGLLLLVGGAITAVAIADVSAMSKGEVERIWLPFALLVLPANAVFGKRANARRMLALQLAAAIALQALLRTS